MGIILNTERRNKKVRFLVLIMYIFLVAGGLSMIYPFMLMISGSVKSDLDVNDFDIIPKFLFDNELLFRKYEAAKYNENLQNYLNTTRDDILNFNKITLPKEPAESLIKDWNEFCTQDIPDSFYQIGFASTLEGKIIQKNERGFRNYIKVICNNDLDVFHSDYAPTIENWFYLKVQDERLMDRTYQLSKDKLTEEFYKFKSTLPATERIYPSLNMKYAKHLKIKPDYKGKIEIYNRLNTTKYNSFNEITLLEKSSGTQRQRNDWGTFIRTYMNPQFVRVSSQAHPNYVQSLRKKYKVIANLNKLYLTDYKRFEDVGFPDDLIHASPDLTDFMLFLKNRTALPVTYISLDTPEIRWNKFLRKKYKNVQQVAEAHAKKYLSFNAIPMPQKEVDRLVCMKNKGSIKRNFMSRNYRMVFEFIFEYGDGIKNTIIYCLLAILGALLVNPLAAYALSRYNLPSQYKVLLFLLATIAFPGQVTMIPNFILLRDLGLLNTFAALIVPTLANGYSIFLLKGFFDSLPRELYEAADIDGANEWHKFWMISMTLSKPILAVIALGAFNAAYANFMYAFIVCQDKSMWTLMVWLFQLQQMSTQGVVFASLMIAAIPTLLIFIFCMNIIMRGIVVPIEK